MCKCIKWLLNLKYWFQVKWVQTVILLNKPLVKFTKSRNVFVKKHTCHNSPNRQKKYKAWLNFQHLLYIVRCILGFVWHCSSFGLLSVAKNYEYKEFAKIWKIMFSNLKSNVDFNSEVRNTKFWTWKFFTLTCTWQEVLKMRQKWEKYLCKRKKSSNMGYMELNNSKLV